MPQPFDFSDEKRAGSGTSRGKAGTTRAEKAGGSGDGMIPHPQKKVSVSVTLTSRGSQNNYLPLQATAALAEWNAHAEQQESLEMSHTNQL